MAHSCQYSLWHRGVKMKAFVGLLLVVMVEEGFCMMGPFPNPNQCPPPHFGPWFPPMHPNPNPYTPRLPMNDRHQGTEPRNSHHDADPIYHQQLDHSQQYHNNYQNWNAPQAANTSEPSSSIHSAWNPSFGSNQQMFMPPWHSTPGPIHMPEYNVPEMMNNDYVPYARNARPYTSKTTSSNDSTFYKGQSQSTSRKQPRKNEMCNHEITLEGKRVHSIQAASLEIKGAKEQEHCKSGTPTLLLNFRGNKDALSGERKEKTDC